MSAVWLVMGLMFAAAGAATVLVGRRATQLGLPRWLGQLILICGWLVVAAGVGALLFMALMLARWLWGWPFVTALSSWC